jgi:hypothetical protein
MKKKIGAHEHQLVRRDAAGEYWLDLFCPECRAAGVTLNDAELRLALLGAEAEFRRMGVTLADVVADEELPELFRLLRRPEPQHRQQRMEFES